MICASAATPISYNVAAWGFADGNADLALNDIPLPYRVSATLPSLNGKYWRSGSTATLVFSDLSAEDARRLMLADGSTGTLTMPFEAIYLRSTGAISYTPSTKTLVFTLTRDTLLDPYTPINPQL